MRATFISFVLLSLVLSTGCSGKRVDLVPAASIPAANGELKVGTDDNSNTTVALKVRNLAPPSRLTPAKTAYVVWIEPRGLPPESKGQLQAVGDSLSGELRFVTTHREFDVFITAEDGVGVPQPTGEPLMRASVMR